MADSRANVFAVEASARYEPCRSGESAPRNRVRPLAVRYGVSIAEPPEL